MHECMFVHMDRITVCEYEWGRVCDVTDETKFTGADVKEFMDMDMEDQVHEHEW